MVLEAPLQGAYRRAAWSGPARSARQWATRAVGPRCAGCIREAKSVSVGQRYLRPCSWSPGSRGTAISIRSSEAIRQTPGLVIRRATGLQGHQNLAGAGRGHGAGPQEGVLDHDHRMLD